jgi:hypothetical protein
MINQLTEWSSEATFLRETSEMAAAETELSLKLAQGRAPKDGVTSDIISKDSQKAVVRTLESAKTASEKGIYASHFFYAAYFMNTRTRPDYCSQLGVNISSFINIYTKRHQKLLDVAQKYQIDDWHKHGYAYDATKYYDLLEPSLLQYIALDMKDVASQLGISERGICDSFSKNPAQWTNTLDYGKLAPEVAQVLLQPE